LAGNEIVNPPPANPKTIDDLFAHAEHFANYCMRGTGHMRPTFFCICEAGPMAMIVWGNDTDEAGKDDLVATEQLMCIATRATAIVTAMESWMRVGSVDDKEFDRKQMPSESFDRQEVITMIGETSTEVRIKILRITRVGQGKFWGLSDFEASPGLEDCNLVTGLAEKGGRFFTKLLPKERPDDFTRDAAAMLLAMKGFKILRGPNLTK
jgi:hypothetical protein